MPWAWLLPVAVVRLYVGDLLADGWGEGTGALVTPVKAIRVGVEVNKKEKICVAVRLRVNERER